MESNQKNFYFQEMNWLICFPNSGNETRKYLYYNVDFIDASKNQIKPQISLSEILDSPMFENRYPHTVCFFRGPVSGITNLQANYLEIRIIHCIEEFWKFLNDLNI
jgi:hypothetical protein